MDRLRKTAERAFKQGEAAGKAKRDVIDADYTEATPKYVFPEPESHALCGECLQADCEGDCDE